MWFEFPLRGGGVQRRDGGLREGPELPGGAARPRGVRPLRAAAADGCRRYRCITVVWHRVTAMSLRPWIQIWCEAKRATIPCPWWLDGLVSCNTFIFTTKIAFLCVFFVILYTILIYFTCTHAEKMHAEVTYNTLIGACGGAGMS